MDQPRTTHAPRWQIAGAIAASGLAASSHAAPAAHADRAQAERWSHDHAIGRAVGAVSLAYCGYLGGIREEEGRSVAVDVAGSAYLTGFTHSSEATFPVVVGPDPTYNDRGAGGDAFVAKVRADGTGFVYVGYVGGDREDVGDGIVVDGAGSAYVAGVTSSSAATFPVGVGPRLTLSGRDAFVAKVTADGTGLVYAGYVGSGETRVGGLGIDGAGNAYAGGSTWSSEATFPVAVGPDLSYNDDGTHPDGFVAKVRADGTALVYAGYVGGSADDYLDAIAVDPAGSAYVAGFTRSTEGSFPVTGGPDPSWNGFEDGFVAQVEADGTSLVYAGYLGGDGDDRARAVAVDAAGVAYVAGRTKSADATFPVAVGPDLSWNSQSDAFVAKVVADGTDLAYAGYIGGDAGDYGEGIAVDDAGSARVAGIASSTEATYATFPALGGPDLTYNGGGDGFVARVSAGGSGLAFAGYIGGDDNDGCSHVALDASGSAYVSGSTVSTEATFPLVIGPSLAFAGGAGGLGVGADAFVAKVIGGSCVLGALPPAGLRGVKTATGGARFGWATEPGAAEYHLNTVTDKRLLRETDPTSPRRAPTGSGETQCTAPSPGPGCTDPDAGPDPRPLLYYRVLCACGALGADEGPVCAPTAPCP